MRGERLFGPYFDLVPAPSRLRDYVLAELGSPSRRWHGLVHHALMLRAVTRAEHPASERRLLVLATLFHDIVYDARRGDNEEASAAIASDWLSGSERNEVVRMILATKRHDLDTDPVTRTLLEADLAILWTGSARLYDFYARGIRAEYAHVPDAAYRSGRSAVLTQLRESLTPTLDRHRAEALAANVAVELTALASGRLDHGAE
ncbi:hypothetical protein [Sphingomonas sp.]|uniref:HD domain-containing protein n=1 Tax=Sphingomonas sp. TaxID=28214 RepID=UPI003B007CE4